MGGKSSSQANQSTSYTDKRLVNESGIAISSEGSNIDLNIESLDADVVGKALDSVNISTVAAGEGFTQLLTLADKLTTTTQATAASMAGTYSNDVLKGVASAETERAGRLDQQTIVLLAGAAVVGLVAMRKGK